MLGIAILAGSGLLALASWRSPRAATIFGAGGAIAGCALGIVPAVESLRGPAVEIDIAWPVPNGAFQAGIDALSGFFLIPIFGLSALAALYGAGYLRSMGEKRSLGPPWFFFNLLVASMALVAVARNPVLFLVAWETMSIASFFLVTLEDEKPQVRDAGWTYLVATHLGTAFLLALFVLGKGAPPGVLFILALVGFGTKAGFLPLHVWLPEAHPAAPSHVSALMSGVMIKTGIYGLLRVLTQIGPPPAWWGWTLIAIGLTSGVIGVLFALAQHDLKRLLAYHSVENIGIIALGIGVGLLGMSAGSITISVLGFAGGLLHVLNHAMFKGLLFLGAGSVLHSTGSRDIDGMGGLLKRMPVTGACFLVGAVAISGLPPLNGFVSEFLIYLGAYKGGASLGAVGAIPLLAAIAGLALIGGLAAACFTKAFGIVFLGEPRSEHAAHGHEAGLAMRAPMLVLAVGCFAVGLLGPFAVSAIAPAVEMLARVPSDPILAGAGDTLSFVSIGGAAFLVLVLLLAFLRRALLSGRSVGSAGTWDCGYAKPTARMQYTASSFAQPLTDLFRVLLRTRRKFEPPVGYFPRDSALETETPDLAREAFYEPLFHGIRRALGRLRWLQHGRVHLYVLYIAITLLVLLLWKLS